MKGLVQMFEAGGGAVPTLAVTQGPVLTQAMCDSMDETFHTIKRFEPNVLNVPVLAQTVENQGGVAAALDYRVGQFEAKANVAAAVGAAPARLRHAGFVQSGRCLIEMIRFRSFS